jgi:hypothetical protein
MLGNAGQTYATTNVARARGEADTRVKVADAARKRRVDMMAAQADTFQKELAQYERPGVVQTHQADGRSGDIYTNVEDKIMVPPNSKEYRFQLNREPQEPSVSNIPTQP